MPPTKKAKNLPPVERKKPLEPPSPEKVAVRKGNIRLKAKAVREPVKMGNPGPSTSAAGLDECWVNMRKDNLLLMHEDKVLRTVPFEPPPPEKEAVLQENIRLEAKAVREPAKTGEPGPSTSAAAAAPVAKPGPASSITLNAAEVQDVSPTDNPYARKIFFSKTNVQEIALQTVSETKNTDPAHIKAAAKDMRYHLFRRYVEKPHFRIREPLHKLRFESEYHEYRLHLALAMGMHSKKNYMDYKKQLDAAGLDECWVNMRKDNLLLVHQDKVVRTVQAKFIHWGAKLAKLSEYMMQLQRNYEAKQQAAAAAKAPALPVGQKLDPLLDALENRSNARRRIVDIQDIYAILAANPPHCACYRSLRWLVFEDEALNRRFGLGAYAIDEDDETDSETINKITALDNSSTEAESVPLVVASSVSPEGLLVPQDDPLGDSRQQDEILPDEPIPQQPEPSVVTVTAVAPVPEGHLQSSGQQEVISISDDDDDNHQPEPEADRSSTTFSDEFKLEEGFWESVENLKRYTNINEYVAGCIRFKFKDNPQKFEQKMAQLDEYVEHFAGENIDQLRKNVLPNGIVKLTRRARRERDALVQQSSVTQPAVPAPSAVATMPSAPVPTLAVTTTQSPPGVSTLFNGGLPLKSLLTKIRRITYEDSPLPLPRDSFDLMSMPGSETVQKRSPQKKSSPRVKIERSDSNKSNHSGYEGEIQYVPIVQEGPIELDDTQNESLINPMDLIERGFGVGPRMRNRMDGLDQQLDATQSQTPKKSASGRKRRLLLDQQTVGFRRQSPRFRSD